MEGVGQDVGEEVVAVVAVGGKFENCVGLLLSFSELHTSIVLQSE